MQVFHTALYSRAELERIAELIGFDAEHYRTAYPDIADAAIDPLRHFLDQGLSELRLPAPLLDAPAGTLAARPDDGARRGLARLIGFDPAFYAATYPDAAGGPLHHFVEAGMRERRLPFALETNSLAERVLWRILDRRQLAYQGSLEGQGHHEPAEWLGVADELLTAGARSGLALRTYRNNFWLGAGIGLLAEGQLGLAACCYNFFFNYYVPLALFGNSNGGLVGTARLRPTLDALTLPPEADPGGGQDGNQDGRHGRRQNGSRRRRGPASPPADKAPTPQAGGACSGEPLMVAVGEPSFLNRPWMTGPPDQLALPRPVLGTLTGVELVGGTSLILQGGHDILYDYVEQDSDRRREPQCPSLVHIVGDVCAVRWPAQALEVDEAFSLLHDHSHNYHHWLLEVLPRYLFARRQGLAAHVPLLVESHLAPQKRELLGFLFDDTPLIELLPGMAARVRRLHWASDLCRNSVQTERPPSKADILFSPDAVAMLRELAAPFLAAPLLAAPPATPGKQAPGAYDHVLVVRRNVEFRRLVNRGVLEEAMRDLGFWSFDPSVAAWVDQVRVFSHARLIVAEAGAALANLVFCSPGCVIVVLVSGHRHSNYFYLTQLADLAGARLYFYECLRLVGSHSIGVQDDMVIPVSHFLEHIRGFIGGVLEPAEPPLPETPVDRPAAAAGFALNSAPLLPVLPGPQPGKAAGRARRARVGAGLQPGASG